MPAGDDNYAVMMIIKWLVIGYCSKCNDGDRTRCFQPVITIPSSASLSYFIYHLFVFYYFILFYLLGFHHQLGGVVVVVVIVSSASIIDCDNSSIGTIVIITVVNIMV